MKQTLSTTNIIDGQTLYADLYTPETSKGLTVFFHGMAEHKERYVELARFLVARDISVLLCDQRGHGTSLFDQTIKGHFGDQDGWLLNLDDLHALIQQAKTITKHSKFVLVSHSMGTIVARSYIKSYGNDVFAFVMSGIPADPPLPKVVLTIAKMLKGKDPRQPSMLLYKNSFLSYDKKTGSKVRYTWLSVEPENVKAYTDDPLCGFPFTKQAFVDLSFGIVDAKKFMTQKPHTPIPIWCIVGEFDVVASIQQVDKMAKKLKNLGYPVATSIKEGLAHEVFFDLNKHSLWRELYQFISTHILKTRS